MFAEEEPVETQEPSCTISGMRVTDVRTWTGVLMRLKNYRVGADVKTGRNGEGDSEPVPKSLAKGERWAGRGVTDRRESGRPPRAGTVPAPARRTGGAALCLRTVCDAVGRRCLVQQQGPLYASEHGTQSAEVCPRGASRVGRQKKTNVR